MSWFNWFVLATDIEDEDETPTTGHYTKKMAAKDTNTSTSQVSSAWHTGRDDEEEEGYITRSRNR